MNAPILLAWLAVAQAPPSAPVEPQRILLDCVALQAGESQITLSELAREKKRRFKDRPAPTREEEQRLTTNLVRDMVVMRLEEQQGQDLGLDRAQIDHINKLNLERDREKAGREGYLAQLQEQGLDALAAEEDQEKNLWRLLWEYSELGNAYAGRRATQDRYIRPGELRELYVENRAALAPVQVQLRMLIVSSAAAGGPEKARESCEQARERVLAGEDMGEIVDELGVEFRDTRGLTQFLPPDNLLDPALRAFASQAKPGELSAVLPLLNKNEQPAPDIGYQLAELHERKEPPQPDFESAEVQRTLTFVFTRQRQNELLTRGRERLRRESYGWVHPSLAGTKPADPSGR